LLRQPAASAASPSSCGPKNDLLCRLPGSTEPLPGTRLAELYPKRAAYQQQHDAAADAVIHSGFVLEPDRDALEAYAQPSRISP
jgi:hypothetical protein